MKKKYYYNKKKIVGRGRLGQNITGDDFVEVKILGKRIISYDAFHDSVYYLVESSDGSRREIHSSELFIGGIK